MPKFVALFVAILFIVSPLLVKGMPSLTQNEGNYKNNNKDELASEEQQQVVTEDDSDEDVEHFEAIQQMEEGTNKNTKTAGKKRRESSRRKNNSHHNSRGNGRPADIVLLVDTGLSVQDVCVETKRLHEITQSWALKYHRRRNRIAIAQFDDYHGKILLQMGKWRVSKLKNAINHIKCPGEYVAEETFGGYDDYTDYTIAINTAKRIFTKTPLRRGTERIAIVITYGFGIDGFHAAKLLRKQFNVHIKAVVIAGNAEEAKADFRKNLHWLERVKEIVTNPVNDIIFENIGNCRYNLDCAKGVECFIPKNLQFWNNFGFCGCLISASTFDTKKYSLDDCCRHVPLPAYALPEHYHDKCY